MVLGQQYQVYQRLYSLIISINIILKQAMILI